MSYIQNFIIHLLILLLLFFLLPFLRFYSSGERQKSNFWMRARVGAQFVTIGFMLPWFYHNYTKSSSSSTAVAAASSSSTAVAAASSSSTAVAAASSSSCAPAAAPSATDAAAKDSSSGRVVS
jgi:microcystin-dependent protein